jgi:hypothetical protein
MTTPDHTKWMVAVCAKVFQKDQIGRSELIELKDPTSGEARLYVLVQNSNERQKLIVEIQSLEAEFSSFLVGRHVVKDGNLYVLNPVDPLFFVLGQSKQIQPSSWQPFDQTVEALANNENIRKCISEAQLGHVCLSLCNDQTDNVNYFKFSEKRALEWLRKKQERVYQVLLQQEKTRDENRQKLLDRRPNGFSNAAAGGSVSSTFYTPDDAMASKPTQTTSSGSGIIPPKTLQSLTMESLQIVCNYLSDEWTTKFIESFEVSEDEVFLNPSEKKATLDSSPTATAYRPVSGDNGTILSAKDAPKPKNVEPARSVANKRLEKVNKRGMSALTSFFKPKAKKQAIVKAET